MVVLPSSVPSPLSVEGGEDDEEDAPEPGSLVVVDSSPVASVVDVEVVVVGFWVVSAVGLRLVSVVGADVVAVGLWVVPVLPVAGVDVDVGLMLYSVVGVLVVVVGLSVLLLAFGVVFVLEVDRRSSVGSASERSAVRPDGT